jgi:serine protease AprX
MLRESPWSPNRVIGAFLLLGLAGGLLLPAAGAASPASWQDKIEPIVLEAARGGDTGFLVILSEQADLSAAADLRTKAEKGEFVFHALRDAAGRTQPPVIDLLSDEGAEFRPFWIMNMIWVRGGFRTLEELARRDDVAGIYADHLLSRLEPAPLDGSEAGDAEQSGTSASTGSADPSRRAIEWNIDHVRAPEVWAEGVTGEGSVVGTLDTGVEWDHPALIQHYRGWNGLTVDHNYNWHDAIHSGSVTTCPLDSPEPCDEHGHGTHVTGTMVGDDGGANRIGMAPGAKWIACRLWEASLRSHISYCVECFQWMLAPTDLADENPDPGLAPHVLNNSWICEPDEGCADPEALRTIVENVRAAGIAVVAGAGNDGSGCSTVFYPPAIYDATYAVGATNTTADAIASFSSRGPVLVDGSDRLKPDVTAPGQNVRSSFPGGGYHVWQGTSMASPHVAGLVALLISANPVLAGRVDDLENIINQTAVPRTSTQSCGGVPGSEVPNNTFGHGRMDAYAAYETALTIPTDVPETRAPGSAPRSPSPALTVTYPNPSRGAVTVAFRLDHPATVRLTVHDVQGRLTALLSDRFWSAGDHELVWDGQDLVGTSAPAGAYYLRLEAEGRVATSRAMLAR